MKTNNNMEMLNIETAKTFIGKTLKITYPGYRGQGGEITFKLGAVVSELDYYRNLKEDVFQEPGSKFANRAEYWESYMTESQLKERREKVLLIDSEGKYTYVYTDKWNDNNFVCGDDYRFVTYEIVE